jgi:hypothetical protein
LVILALLSLLAAVIIRRANVAYNNPVRIFQRLTGYSMPEAAIIRIAEREPIVFHGDSMTYLVLDVETSYVDSLLNGPPPWGKGWVRGPINPRIPHCFKADKLKMFSIPENDGIFYGVRNRFGDYHNGELLALDPVHGRVWFASWDY